MLLGQPDLELWVLAALFSVESGQDALVASCFLAVVAIDAAVLRSASERLGRGN